MSKERKPLRTALKILFLIPMMGLIYYGFSEKVTAQNEGFQNSSFEDDKAYTLVYQSPPQKMTKAEYYSQTKFILKYPDGKLEEKSYKALPQNLKDDYFKGWLKGQKQHVQEAQEFFNPVQRSLDGRLDADADTYRHP